LRRLGPAGGRPSELHLKPLVVRFGICHGSLTPALHPPDNPTVPDSVSNSTPTREFARSAVFRRSFKKSFPSAVRGQGVYVWDSEGKRYLDFSGSAAVNLIGHSVPEISVAIMEQAAQLEFVHTSQFTTPVAEEYARELIEFAGENFRGGSVYFTCGGSEAVETGLKSLAQAKKQTLDQFLQSLELIVHGSTIATNTVIQRNGPKTALICTEGFRDVVYFRDGFKPERYNIRLNRAPDFVPRHLRIPVTERINYKGDILTPLDEESVVRAASLLTEQRAQRGKAKENLGDFRKRICLFRRLTLG